MAQTAEQYYGDPANHGNYQYLPISQILDSMELEIAQDQDHYLKGTKRPLLCQYALDGVREFNAGALGDVLSLELTIGDDLQFILPQDFVDYLKVYYVGPDDKLYLLDYNSSMSIAKSFLQDDQNEIIFDDQGDEIEVDGLNVFAKPYKRYRIVTGEFYATQESVKGYISTHNVHRKQSDSNFTYFSKHGDFVIDRRRGAIAFSSNLANSTIVLQYISDGLQQSAIDGEKITIHKHLKVCLEDYMYMRGIDRKRSVPAVEKQRARARYKSTKHKAKILLSDINSHRIAKAFRAAFKPLKF